MDNLTITDSAAGKGEIVVYQPDEVTRLEVKVEDETVWLNRNQMALLFGRDVKTIGKHINNALTEELKSVPTVAFFATVQKEGSRYVERKIEYYNLDMILSVGYRVKSEQGIRFRRWANEILKEYLLKGYSLNHRLMLAEERIDKRLMEHDLLLKEHQDKIDFFVRTSLPPVEGVFYDGQIFDAYVFVTNLIRSAKQTLVLIDNYVDESVLMVLAKRQTGVEAEIRTGRLTESLKQDLAKHNSQYPPIVMTQNKNIHDRFLIVDEDVYHIGASLKDLGKKLFAFSKINVTPSVLIQ
mgnify:CR=1 FL=1